MNISLGGNKRGTFCFSLTVADVEAGQQQGVPGVRWGSSQSWVTKAGGWRAISEGPKVLPDRCGLAVGLPSPGQSLTPPRSLAALYIETVATSGGCRFL